MSKSVALLFAFVYVVASCPIVIVPVAEANPFFRDFKLEGEVAPPDGTIPPAVSIVAPENNTAYSSHVVTLNFSVAVANSNNISLSLSELYYKPSWRASNTHIDLTALSKANNHSLPSEFSINLTGVPEGSRSLEVYAVARGISHVTGTSVNNYTWTSTTYYIGFVIVGSSVVNFTIDTILPKLRILYLENKNFSTPDVPLTLNTSENTSSISYSLDGQSERTISGNTTLTGLSDGTHNITVYALDNAGNSGFSDTVTFNANSEPMRIQTLIVATLAIAVGLTFTGFVVYYIRKGRQPQSGKKPP